MQEMSDLSNEEKLSYSNILVNYCLSQHEQELINILKNGDATKHFTLHINTVTLFEVCMELSYVLLNKPQLFLPLFDKAIIKACRNIYDEHPSKDEMVIKLNINARMSGMPICPEVTRNLLPNVCDIGKFLSVTGTVVRVAPAKLLEYERQFMCVKCKHTFMVKADFKRYYVLDKPKTCPNPDDCRSSRFTPTSDKDVMLCKDYQEIKIQEHIQKLPLGRLPQSMWVVLEDDLVDVCKPGDDVTIYGTVRHRWKSLNAGSKTDIEMAIYANQIEIISDQRSPPSITDDLQTEYVEFWEEYKDKPFTGRNEILSSFCPQICGLYVVKLAITLVLIGGIPQVDKSKTKMRGESHLLLVGDPGTGKSQFLKYASKIFPRSVLTTGIGSTNAGLTVTAVRDSGQWQLEAGALVLADGGLCCIDEFNSMREHDRATIHEAMEQQTISVAKGGLVCTLNSRCTILAATNPKGALDPNTPLNVNVALASPLLSRFDLILVLRDTENEEWDKTACEFMLGREIKKTRNANVEWSMEKLQTYLYIIKQLKPTMTSDANSILQKYYLHQRQSDSRSAARTTVRMLESLIRLSQAHARLMFRTQVLVMDAVVAVTLMETSMKGLTSSEGTSNIHSHFPTNAEEEYCSQASEILKKLQLDDILNNELDRLCMAKEKTDVTAGIADSVVKSRHYLNHNHSSTGLRTMTVDPLCGRNSLENFELVEDTQRSTSDICANNETFTRSQTENFSGQKRPLDHEEDLSFVSGNLNDDESFSNKAKRILRKFAYHRDDNISGN